MEVDSLHATRGVTIDSIKDLIESSESSKGRYVERLREIAADIGALQQEGDRLNALVIAENGKLYAYNQMLDMLKGDQNDQG